MVKRSILMTLHGQDGSSLGWRGSGDWEFWDSWQCGHAMHMFTMFALSLVKYTSLCACSSVLTMPR